MSISSKRLVLTFLHVLFVKLTQIFVSKLMELQLSLHLLIFFVNCVSQFGTIFLQVQNLFSLLEYYLLELSKAHLVMILRPIVHIGCINRGQRRFTMTCMELHLLFEE